MMRFTPESNPGRYFGWLYSSGSERRLLEALFGIEAEIAESLRPSLDHHVAHSRLQWWREECERTAGGRALHPLTQEAVAAFGETGQTRDGNVSAPLEERATSTSALAGLSGFVDVTVWDLAGATYESRRELTAYCERWAAAMIEPVVTLALATGGAGPANGNWRAIGASIRELEMLADLAREAHSGRLRVPLDEIEAAMADPASLAKPPWPAAIAKVLYDRHQALRAEIAREVDRLDPPEQQVLRGLVVWAALAWRSSRRAQRVLPDRVLPRRFEAIADTWFAWRVARRATMGRFKLG